MPDGPILPPLPEDHDATLATLHAYALGVGAIPRAHGLAHPKWWHISLEVKPYGLVTDNVSIPDGRVINLRLDPNRHRVVLAVSDGSTEEFSMTGGLTGTEFADELIEAVARYGLEGTYDREKFESGEARQYDPDAAARLFSILTVVNQLFERHRAGLPGETGPIQLWPHGFDLAFEWFGTRVERYEEEGEVVEYPSQLNLGFYPAGRAYFYSNPWPFEEEKLTSEALPSGADWFTDGWEGSILYYDELQDDPKGAERLLSYARAVFDIASPNLMA